MEFKTYVQKPYEVQATENDDGDYSIKDKDTGEITVMPKRIFEQLYTLKEG